ncbi:MAG TPA: hypothetical protein VFU60_21295 [Ktedonobacterales bacterium]|nr:hypothetical protein [Ktedonobacterales bacterium]
MADTKSSANSPARGASGGSGGSAGSGGGSTGGSLGQRLAGFLRGPSGGGLMGRKTSSTSRFIVGSITFILVAELLTYLVNFADVSLNLHLQQPILASAGSNWSWLSWFFLINVVIILGLWIGLNKMGFFPRDMWASRNGTTNSTARGASSNGNGAKNGSQNNVNQIPGIGATRTRAERRYAAAAAEAAAEAAAKSKKKGNGATAATPTTRTSKRAAVIEDVGTQHDAAYERARTAQRQRQRRARR